MCAMMAIEPFRSGWGRLLREELKVGPVCEGEWLPRDQPRLTRMTAIVGAGRSRPKSERRSLVGRYLGAFPLIAAKAFFGRPLWQ